MVAGGLPDALPLAGDEGGAPVSYDPDFIDALACKLAAERASVELELVGGMLSDPVRGVEAAAREGVHRDLLGQDDLRAIFVAAEVGRDRGVLTVLRFARFLLRHLRLWDESDSRTFARGMRWGNEALAALACSYPGPSAVPYYARRLGRIDARQREARACYCRMVGLLGGTVEPTEAPAQSIVTTHTKHTAIVARREELHVCN